MFFIIEPKVVPSCLKMALKWFLDCPIWSSDAPMLRHGAFRSPSWGSPWCNIGPSWPTWGILAQHGTILAIIWAVQGCPNAGATPTDPHLDPSIPLLSQLQPKWHTNTILTQGKMQRLVQRVTSKMWKLWPIYYFKHSNNTMIQNGDDPMIHRLENWSGCRRQGRSLEI